MYFDVVCWLLSDGEVTGMRIQQLTSNWTLANMQGTLGTGIKQASVVPAKPPGMGKYIRPPHQQLPLGHMSTAGNLLTADDAVLLQV